MPERTIDWGGADSPYETHVDRDGNGRVVLAEDTSGGTVLLQWNESTGQWEYGGPVGDITSGRDPAETIEDSSTPTDLSFSGSADRDIHDHTEVDISNSSGAEATEDITVTLYDGVDNTGTEIATETISVTVADAASTTETFLNAQESLDDGDYFIEVTQSGTALTIDSTREFTNGATFTFGQSATGAFETETQDGVTATAIDPISGRAEFEAISTEDINAKRTLGGPSGFETLADAIADLPSDGGVIELADTVTETGNVTIDRRIKLVGQGYPYSVDAPAYIDLGGNDLTISAGAGSFDATGCTFDSVQMQNGDVYIGEHDGYNGRHDIELSVIGGKIEFRGGHLDARYHIKSDESPTDGIVWNLDGEGRDYFNHNEVALHSHSAAGDAVKMTGVNTSWSQFYGNVFTMFNAENVSGTGWVVDDSISLKGNRFLGYGVHDGGVDVQPTSPVNNEVHFSKVRPSGTFNISGVVHVNDDISSVTSDERTVQKLSGTDRYLDDAEGAFIDQTYHVNTGDFIVNRGSFEIGTSATVIANVTQSAVVELHAQSTSDNTRFIDDVAAIGGGGTDVNTRVERNTPPARTYTVNGTDLELSVDSGTFICHIVHRRSEGK